MNKKTINTGRDEYDIYTDNKNNLLRVYSHKKKRNLIQDEIYHLRHTKTGSVPGIMPLTENERTRAEAEARAQAQVKARAQERAQKRAQERARARAQAQTTLKGILNNNTPPLFISKAGEGIIRKTHVFADARIASTILREQKNLKADIDQLNSILRMHRGGPSKQTR